MSENEKEKERKAGGSVVEVGIGISAYKNI